MTDKEISTEQDSNKNERQSANWDLSNAVRNYSTLVVTQIAVAFFSFASVTLCSRTLGAEGYGGIISVIAASSIAQIFVSWTCVGLARFGVEEFVGSGKISKSFWARTLIFLPNTLIFLAFSLLWFPLLADWLKLPPEAFWLVLLHFASMAVWLHVQHAFQGAKLPKLQGILLAVERLLIFLILLGLLYFGELTWLSAVWAYILPPVLMTLIGLWKLRNLVSWKFEFDTEIFKKIMKFSVPLIPFSFIGYFSTNYLDAIFISQFLNKTELGIYSIAYQINGILMQFPTLAGSLIMPLFVTLQSTNQDSFVRKYVADALPVMTLVWGIGCVLVAASGMIFIPLVFGEEVAEASNVLWVLVVSSAFAFASLVGYIPLISKNSATYIGIPMAIAAALANFFGNFFLIPKYGLIGCAWATVLATAASFLTVLLISHYKYPLKHRWTLQSTLPTLIACSTFLWTKSLLITFTVFSIVIILLLILHRKSLRDSINVLLNARKILS